MARSKNAGAEGGKSSAKTVKANKDGIQKQKLGTIDKRVRYRARRRDPARYDRGAGRR